jgi:hypothetical protein
MDQTQEIHFLREKLVEQQQQITRMRESYAGLLKLTDAQAQDAGIWYIKDSVLLRPEPAQVAIRSLHAAIENDRDVFLPRVPPAPTPSSEPPGETL